MKRTWTEERPPRIGLIMWDHPSGWAILEALKEYAPEFGLEFVGHEVVPLLGALDTSVEWIRLSGKKPDCILCYTYAAGFVTCVKDAARLEIQEKGIKLFCGPVAIDEVILDIVGKDGEGWLILGLTATNIETDLPEIGRIIEGGQKYRGFAPEQVPSVYIGGWGHLGKIMVEGVRLAIEKVGFEKLTGRAVRDALCTMTNFDTGISPPTTIRNNRPLLVDHVRLQQVQQGRIVPVAEWEKIWEAPWFKEEMKNLTP